MLAPELAGKTISNLSTGDATDAVKLEDFPKEIYADQMIGLITGALVRKKAGRPLQSLSDRIPASLKVMHTYHDLFSKSVPGAQYDNPGASVDSCVAALGDVLNTFRSYGVAAEYLSFSVILRTGFQKKITGDKELTALVQMPP